MPTKMAKFCREKAVLISVYEEKTRRRVSATRHHHHHHHYLHDASAGKGYNRRAELLHYSQTLRESPPPAAAASTPLLTRPKTKPSNNQQPTAKNTVAVQSKAGSAKNPTCLGDWKILIPSFIRSLVSPKGKKDKKKRKQSGSGTDTMKVLMKSIQVQKKRGFMHKLCSTF